MNKPDLSDPLYISPPNDETDPGLYLKPIPGQIVAIIEPGPLQQEYARLFAMAGVMRTLLESLADGNRPTTAALYCLDVIAGNIPMNRANITPDGRIHVSHDS